MTLLIAYPVAFGATLVTTLAVSALWILYARVAEKSPVDTVLLPLIFLFLPMIFFVSAFGNIVAVMLGQLAGLAWPPLRLWVAVAASGALIWLGMAWSQRRLSGLAQGPVPLEVARALIFCLTDMLILWGALSLLPYY